MTCGVAFLAISALWPLHAVTYKEIGWDFPQFYLASHVPLKDLYNRAAYLQWAERLLGGADVHYFPPYVRPPAFALPLKLGRFLSYRSSLVLWLAGQFACYVGALALLRRSFGYPPEMLLGWALFYPAMHGIWEGQDAPAVLLLVVAAFRQLIAGRERLAGVLFALCLYKFNLFALIPVYLIVHRRWQAFRYAAVGAIILGGLSFVLVPPSVYLSYLSQIPSMTIRFEAATMPGWRGLVGGQPLLYAGGVIIIGIVAWWTMRQSGPVQGFAVAVTGSLLIAFHIGSYDPTLLALPIVASIQGGGRLPKIASLALLLGLPWFVADRSVAAVELVLFGGLVLAGAPKPARLAVLK